MNHKTLLKFKHFIVIFLSVNLLLTGCAQKINNLSKEKKTELKIIQSKQKLLKKIGFDFHLTKPYQSRISDKPFWHLRMSGRLKYTKRMWDFFTLIKPCIKNPIDYFERKGVKVG